MTARGTRCWLRASTLNWGLGTATASSAVATERDNKSALPLFLMRTNREMNKTNGGHRSCVQVKVHGGISQRILLNEPATKSAACVLLACEQPSGQSGSAIRKAGGGPLPYEENCPRSSP